MKRFFLPAFFLFFLLSPAFSAKIEKNNTEKRVTVLEKKVVKIEKRVDKLENKGYRNPPQSANDRNALNENPLSVTFLSKEQLIGSSKMGIRVNFKIENPTRFKINAFLGDLILKDEKGEPFYKYKYYYNQKLNPYSEMKTGILVMDGQTKIYLKLLKAGRLELEFKNQKIFSELEFK